MCVFRLCLLWQCSSIGLSWLGCSSYLLWYQQTRDTGQCVKKGTHTHRALGQIHKMIHKRFFLRICLIHTKGIKLISAQSQMNQNISYSLIYKTIEKKRKWWKWKYMELYDATNSLLKCVCETLKIIRLLFM